MFDDFHPICDANQSFFSYLFLMMDNASSSDSSRESTPRYENDLNGPAETYPAASNTIADLSHHFDQHTLTPRRPNIARETPTLRARDPQNHQSPSSFSNRVCRQRQSFSRLNRSSTHLSRISALVEDMVHTGLPAYDPSHPTSLLNDSSTSPSLSPDEQPSSNASYFGFTPLSPIPSFSSASTSTTSSVGAPNHHALRHSHSYKIDKDIRHGSSRDGSGGQRMVQKKIRMRKSSKNLGKPLNKRG